MYHEQPLMEMGYLKVLLIRMMLIINIVAVAGAVNNPMFRTRIFLRIGVSVLCMALLGASYLLTRLFILTCMGTQKRTLDFNSCL